MKILLKIIHLIVMLIDPILIASIIIVGLGFNWWLAGVMALATHYTQMQTGGWFFAWKKKNRADFERNWTEILSK